MISSSQNKIKSNSKNTVPAFFSHFASNSLNIQVYFMHTMRHDIHKLAFSKVAWTWTFFPASTGLEITIRKSIEPNYDWFQHQASNAVTGNSRDNICVQLMHQQSSRMNWHLHPQGHVTRSQETFMNSKPQWSSLWKERLSWIRYPNRTKRLGRREKFDLTLMPSFLLPDASHSCIL